MKILVIGAGIGGLSAALSLHQAGFKVRLFESVPEPGALGVGINLQPNAVRELYELGLEGELASAGIATSTFAMYNKHGQLIWSEPRGRAAGYNWPQYSIHRGDLLMILLRAAQMRLEEGNILTGHHLAEFEQDADGVTAHFVDRRTGEALRSERGDVLIGADGIHSTVRARFYPNEGAPVFCGEMQWRAAVEAAAFLDGRTHAVIGHRDQRFVVYPMSTQAERRGRALINWIAELRVREESYTSRPDWSRRVPKEVFASAFARWKFPWLDVPGLIDVTDAIYEFPKCDRNPVQRWSFDRVSLLGDAAHPMLPTGSQAGSQAVVDARVLARALLLESTPQAALKRYESERLAPMSEVTLRNRELGPELAMQIAEDRAPDGFVRIEDVIPREEMANITESYKRAAGFDSASLNARPSILLDLLAERGRPSG